MANKLNIANSFRAVKVDILKIEGELLGIKEQQTHILEQLEKLTSKLERPARKKISTKKISKKR